MIEFGGKEITGCENGAVWPELILSHNLLVLYLHRSSRIVSLFVAATYGIAYVDVWLVGYVCHSGVQIDKVRRALALLELSTESSDEGRLSRPRHAYSTLDIGPPQLVASHHQ